MKNLQFYDYYQSIVENTKHPWLETHLFECHSLYGQDKQRRLYQTKSQIKIYTGVAIMDKANKKEKERPAINNRK